jgi:hypothetical protein
MRCLFDPGLRIEKWGSGIRDGSVTLRLTIDFVKGYRTNKYFFYLGRYGTGYRTR